MLYREICRTLSFFLWGLCIPLFLPLGIALYVEWIVPEKYPQPPAAFAFLLTILISFLLGAFFRLLGRKSSGNLYRKEAFILVLLVYLLISAVSALPFCFNRTLPNYVDAFFETVSGYTTTGATVMEGKRYKEGIEVPITQSFTVGEEKTYSYYGTIHPLKDPKTNQTIATGIEAVSPALLVWRSQTQFLGGGGIVILFLALLPILGVGGKLLYQMETTGPSKETMAPRITETASWLWKIYCGLALLQMILLMVTNASMPLLDALCISFSTISTGGFAPRNESIASYNNPCTDLVVMVFMLLGSLNFSIYFFFVKGKFQRLKDKELSLFLFIILLSALFAAFSLYGKTLSTLCAASMEKSTSFSQALLHGSFQVISSQTSTGFATANFDVWPFQIQMLMFVLMFVGGMAGSTAGGIKIVRFQIFFRVILDKIESIFRPDAVRSLRIGGKTIEEKVAMTALTFFVIVVFFAIGGAFLLILDGVDPETALTTSGSMLNNVGFAFRMGGPEHSFAFLSPFGKLLSCLWMIAGRLEYFALLVIFLPSFWKSRS